MAALRVGVDVGGTNTDAVVLRGQDVLGKAKSLTTDNVFDGIQRAVTAALRDASVAAADVRAVMLGTTHFINALVQRRGLAPVALLRLCGPATRALPPGCDLPPDVRAAIALQGFMLAGGHEYDGGTEIAPPCEREVRDAVRAALAGGARGLALSSVFSPVNGAHEALARDWVQEELRSAARQAEGIQPLTVHLTLSSEVGHLGLLEREAAATLNAALRPLADAIVPAAAAALRAAGLSFASLYFTSNDGTLMSADAAQQLPIATFQSGPVNSLRGAAFLSRVAHGIVIDIGGTTTDVGAVAGSLPRSAPGHTTLAGVRTNFVMPDVASFGLGGGSHVAWRGGGGGGGEGGGELEVEVGPSSVGSKLLSSALVFGGSQATATDVAAVLGRMPLGDAAAAEGRLPRHVATAAWGEMQRLLRDAVDAAKTAAGAPFGGGVSVARPKGGPGWPNRAAVRQLVELRLSWRGCRGGARTWSGCARRGVRQLPSRASCLGPRDQPLDLCLEQPRASSSWTQGPEAMCTDPRAPHPGPLLLAAKVARPGAQTVEPLYLKPLAPKPQPLESPKSPSPAILVAVRSCGAADVDVVVVGGGAKLCGERLPGASRLLVPPHADVANAVGAAIPQVSGMVDSVLQLGAAQQLREQELAAARQLAVERAVAAGAVEGSCQVVQQETPLAYLPGGATRMRIRVVGDLDLSRGVPLPAATAPATSAAGVGGAGAGGGGSAAGPGGSMEGIEAQQAVEEKGDAAARQPGAAAVSSRHGDDDPALWQPQVDANGDWLVSARDLAPLALGCGLLGCGGGGSPFRAQLKVQRLIDSGATVRVRSLAALPADALCCEGGFMGAPTVGIEKLDSDQAATALEAAVRAAGGKPLDAVLPGEVGGGNGLEPLALAAQLGLPCLDADLMGRAFPELQMSTAAIYGVPQTPAAAADEKGNALIVAAAADARWVERLLRPAVSAMGCSAGYSAAPLTAGQLQRVAVCGSLSLAWRLGRAALAARHGLCDPVAAIAAQGGGRVLFTGKVVDVQRSTTEGFAVGHIVVEGSASLPAGSAATPPQRCVVRFQNENLVAELQGGGGAAVAAAAGGGEQGPGGGGGGAGWRVVLACVPDLIVLCERAGGEPVATEEARYGLRVAVLGLPAHPLLRTPQALQVVGPAAFGEGRVAYEPLGAYQAPEVVPQAG